MHEIAGYSVLALDFLTRKKRLYEVAVWAPDLVGITATMCLSGLDILHSWHHSIKPFSTAALQVAKFYNICLLSLVSSFLNIRIPPDFFHQRAHIQTQGIHMQVSPGVIG